MSRRQLATFTLDGAVYGVDVLRVQEVLRGRDRTPVPLGPPGLAGMVNLRGQVVMAIDLRCRLGLSPLAVDVAPMMLVVQVGGEPISLLVDGVGDVVDVDEDEIEAPPQTLPPALREVIVGAVPDRGHLVLVLDVDQATTT